MPGMDGRQCLCMYGAGRRRQHASVVKVDSWGVGVGVGVGAGLQVGGAVVAARMNAGESSRQVEHRQQDKGRSGYDVDSAETMTALAQLVTFRERE